jgi:DNA-binding NarL/FixJ family response regulator
MAGLSPIRVALADDHTMVRESLARVLAASGAIEIVGEAGDGAQTLAMVEKTSPDVVVLDYSMPDHDPAHLIQTLLRARPEIKILVLTVHENVHYAVRVLEAGAHGYLIKSEAVEALVDAIAAVCSGRIYLSPAMSQEVLQHLRRPRRERVGLEALSQREFDFLRIFGAGNSLQQCAKEMNVSVSTASTYRARIMEKLKLKTTAELIRFALEQNIVG